MKKYLLLSICIVLSLVASAETLSGTCGDNLTWTLTDDGVLTISGTGDMKSDDVPWRKYSTSIKSSVITDGVTSIGERAFYACSGLTSITIPNSVTSIGDDAFYGCSGLTSITIPNSVTSIGDYAFFGCSGLTSVTIPNLVTRIGGRTFQNCSGLTSITIPDGVTSIGDYAFQGCSGLTSVTIPNSVTSIGTFTFYDCNKLTSVNVRFKDTDDFANYIQRTDIASVFHVQGLFDKTYYIYIAGELQKDITIPNSVTSIGEDAFRECSSLTSITIPNSVTSIGNGAFRNCARLISIYVNCTTPPNCGNSWTFACTDTRDKYDVYDYTTLHVPMGSGEAYASAYEWRYFKKIKEDMDIDGTTYYTTLEINQGNEGYVKHYIKADDTYTVYIGADGDSRINTVMYNGEDVTDRLVDGYFTTPAIKHASRLCVSFEQNLSGISSQNLSDIRVYGNDGKLYISGVDTNEDMSIYDLNGKLIKNSRIDGDTCVEISGGTYIVRIGSRTFKVSM